MSYVQSATFHHPAPDGWLWPDDAFAHKLGTAVAMVDPDGVPLVGVVVAVATVDAGQTLAITVTVAELELTPRTPRHDHPHPLSPDGEFLP